MISNNLNFLNYILVIFLFTYLQSIIWISYQGMKTHFEVFISILCSWCFVLDYFYLESVLFFNLRIFVKRRKSSLLFNTLIMGGKNYLLYRRNSQPFAVLFLYKWKCISQLQYSFWISIIITHFAFISFEDLPKDLNKLQEKLHFPWVLL